MREFPLWVPHDGGHLAALLTIPDGEARGLVLMLSGVSLAEEIGSFPLFPLAAARLAESGLGTVRLDYAGLGDSSGDTPTWSLSVMEPAIKQAVGVLAVAQDAIAVDDFAVVGSCFGTRVALYLTKQPDCVGAVCLSSPIIEQGIRTRLRTRVRGFRIMSLLRSNRLLRRLVLRPLRRAFAEMRPSTLVIDALAELDHSRILFLYSGLEVEENSQRREARKRLEAMSRGLSQSRRERYDVRVLPTGRLTGFDLLVEAERELILETVVEWIEGSFRNGNGQPVTAPDAASLPRERVGK